MNSGDMYARQVLSTLDVNMVNSISMIRDPFRLMFGDGFAQESDIGVCGYSILSPSTGSSMSISQIGTRLISVYAR